MLKDIHDKGFIIFSVSSWGAPILFIHNKDGSSFTPKILDTFLAPRHMFTRVQGII